MADSGGPTGGDTTSGQAANEIAQAQRIVFRADTATGESVVRRFRGPYPRAAASRPLSVDELLATAAVDPPPPDELDFLFLPSGSASPIELQRSAETWMNDPALSAVHPTIDLVLQSDRVLWRPGRAVVLGAGRRLPDLLAGLIDFAFYEGELRRLEQELEAEWSVAEADVPLTHGVDQAALARREHVNQMTRRTALRRIRLARLAPHLEKSSAALPGPARRLSAELALQAEVVERLKYVDERLEVFEDLYELANDRLSEFAYFRQEYRLEVWIVVLLVVEALLILGEMGLSWYLAE